MMRRDAIISNDGLYRYRLERTWDLGKPKCLYVMLNPSDADDKIDDRTIKACIRFAQDWGYGALMVGNLFAYRSPYPRKLKTVDDPIGPENDLYLAAMLSEADKVIAAWGNGDTLQGRDAVVLSLLEDAKPVWTFGLTQKGQPKHPGRLPKETPLLLMRKAGGKHP